MFGFVCATAVRVYTCLSLWLCGFVSVCKETSGVFVYVGAWFCVFCLFVYVDVVRYTATRVCLCVSKYGHIHIYLNEGSTKLDVRVPRVVRE